jgi:hypothetical protein
MTWLRCRAARRSHRTVNSTTGSSRRASSQRPAERLLALEIELARSYGVTWEGSGRSVGCQPTSRMGPVHDPVDMTEEQAYIAAASRSPGRAMAGAAQSNWRGEEEFLALKEWLEKLPPQGTVLAPQGPDGHALMPPSVRTRHGSGRVCGNLCAYAAGESTCLPRHGSRIFS